MGIVRVIRRRVRRRSEILDVVAECLELVLERPLELEAGVVGGDENLAVIGGHGDTDSGMYAGWGVGGGEFWVKASRAAFAVTHHPPLPTPHPTAHGRCPVMTTPAPRTIPSQSRSSAPPTSPRRSP